MKTIYFCRHAKSSWAEPGKSDADRVLNERGLLNAPMMAYKFNQRNEPIDLLVSSPATRAHSTALFFARQLGINETKVLLEPRIYEANVKTLVEVINDLPDPARRIMLFGHNPGFSNIIDHLTGEALGNLPTCGIARIDLYVDSWQDVTKAQGKMAWLDFPKQYELDEGA